MFAIPISHRPITTLICALALLLGMTFDTPARAATTSPAETFVQQNIDRGSAILNNAALSPEQRHAQFRTFMLNLTDPRRIGLFTLGPYANSAPKADVETFIAAFTDYLIAVYETRLTKYKTQSVKVTGSQERAADDAVVDVDVTNPAIPNDMPLKAAFRVRKTADGHPVVTDLQVEGVWLALSERSDFTGFLQQHNGSISALNQDLKKQTEQLRNSPA